ncbi:hypothetical protein REPUB_Repub04eG0014000 [Reevesia pubescens]
MDDSKKKGIEDKLPNSIALAKRVCSAVDEAKSDLEKWFEALKCARDDVGFGGKNADSGTLGFDIVSEVCLAINEAKWIKVECGEVGKRVNQLSQMLKILFFFINSAHTFCYLRPVKCIVAKVKNNFELAMAIVYKWKRRNLVCRRFTNHNATQFRELSHPLDDSINDMEWLVTVYDPQSRAIGSTANKKSATFLVWSCVATLQMGRQMEDRIEAVQFLALIAQETDEYKNIIFEGGVPPLQKLLKENYPPLEAQIIAANALCLLATANLVASIAKHSPELREYDLIRENVIWRLVTLLSSEPSTLKLKISCSKALLMLARESVSNCRTLTETKAMLCLAKLVETEQDELQYNCLMVIREITTIAESNNDFRHSIFKSTSPAAKAVVDELLMVIKEFVDTKLRIPAIKSIGSLAKSFSAEDSQVISPLVARLDNTDQEIAMEAAIALQKFVCTDNHLCWERPKSIIEFYGVPLLMKLLDEDKKLLQPHGLALICYLAKHDSNSNVLITIGALTALQTTGRMVPKEHPDLEELGSDSICELQSNQTDNHEQEGSIKQIITEKSEVALESLQRQELTVYLPKLVNLQDCLGHFPSPFSVVLGFASKFYKAWKWRKAVSGSRVTPNSQKKICYRFF